MPQATPTPASETLPDRASAPGMLALSWVSLRRRLPRTALFMAAMCTAIGLLLAALDGSLGTKLVYSFAIGLCCWAIVDGLRLLLAWLIDLGRARRGEPPATQAIQLGWVVMAPLLLAGNAAGAILGLRIAELLTGHRAMALDLGSPVARITAIVTLVAGITALFSITTMERLATARASAEAAQRQAAQARLKLLESQLEPHMLFNTLANLRVLIKTDPTRAQEMLDHLIDFLRGTLDASRSGTHALAAEFARVADYLALMAVRMGPRLSVALDLPDELRALQVPPLLLQPLVENAIKHGLEPSVAGGRIEVSARREGDSLQLRVRDTGVGPTAAGSAHRGAGFGTSQVRERLATLYGERASFELEASPDDRGGTLAHLTLPIAG